MENKICLDTSILVDFLRNKPDAVSWIKQSEETSSLATTTINLFELYYGAYKSLAREKNLKALDELKSRLIILNISEKIAQEASKQLAKLESEGNEIDFRDLFIGVTALSEGFAIKTVNQKHFSKIEGLTLT